MPLNEVQAWQLIRQWKDIDRRQRLVVFYADSREEWDHLGPMVTKLALGQNRPVVYLTADAKDPVLRRPIPKVKAFCVGRGAARRQFFAQLASFVVVMAGPHFDAIRLPISKDVRRRILVLPAITSVHTKYGVKDLQPFDTILCGAAHQVTEVETMFAGAKKRPKCVPHGLGRLDLIIERATRTSQDMTKISNRCVFLAAESPELLSGKCDWIVSAVKRGFRFRIHLDPDMKVRANLRKKLRARFASVPQVRVEEDSVAASVCASNYCVTDCSSAGIEFALAKDSPVLFIDTQRDREVKMPLDGRRPFELACRPLLGKAVSESALTALPTSLQHAESALSQVLPNRERIRGTLFHVGMSGATGAAIIEAACVGADPNEAVQRALQSLRMHEIGKKYEASPEDDDAEYIGAKAERVRRPEADEVRAALDSGLPDDSAEVAPGTPLFEEPVEDPVDEEIGRGLLAMSPAMDEAGDPERQFDTELIDLEGLRETIRDTLQGDAGPTETPLPPTSKIDEIEAPKVEKFTRAPAAKRNEPVDKAPNLTSTPSVIVSKVEPKTEPIELDDVEMDDIPLGFKEAAATTTTDLIDIDTLRHLIDKDTERHEATKPLDDLDGDGYFGSETDEPLR